MHIMHIYFELTIVIESTRQAARPAMMKPRRESSFCCLRAELLRRRLDGGLVAERALKSSVVQS